MHALVSCQGIQLQHITKVYRLLTSSMQIRDVWQHAGFLAPSTGTQTAQGAMPDSQLQQEGDHIKSVELAGIYDSRGRPSALYLQWLALLSLTGVLCSTTISASSSAMLSATPRLAFDGQARSFDGQARPFDGQKRPFDEQERPFDAWLPKPQQLQPKMRMTYGCHSFAALQPQAPTL